MNERWHQFLALAVVTAIVSGCGSAPPPRSAQDEISKAERFVDSAKDWNRKGQVDQALDNYKQAKELIGKGISFAEGNELSRLRNMEEEVRGAVTALEMRKLTQEASRMEKPPIAANAQVKTEDPEERKRKEEEAAKKKLAAGEARATAAKDDLAKSLSAPLLAAKKEQKGAEPESDVAEKKERPKTGGKEQDKPGEEAAAPIGMRAEGPYPALTDKSPPVQVCKLETRGKAAIVYFQLYNNAEAGKRIMNAIAYFKDVNNQPLIDPRSTAVFPFRSFKPDAANIFEQPLVTALTAGSAQVTGFEGLRLVGVGESERAKDIKKAAVKVIYSDGKSDVDTGPAEGPTDVPGLKALEAKK